MRRARKASSSVGATPKTQKLSIDTIRTLAMDAVQKANAGHPGHGDGARAARLRALPRVMRHNPANPDWPDRDRFVLSAGHACILQYAALHLAGYDLSLEELKRFRQWGSRTPGHPEHFLTAGIETTTGPLGQGFANGVGMAIAERFLAERYNRPHHEIVDHRIYAICSDGDLMEGVSKEAASIAGHLGLGRLVYFYDDNHITIDGSTALSFTTEDKAKRFEAYGWHVQPVDDSEDVDALERAIRAAQAEERAPVADRRPQPHRLRRAERGRHRQGARRAARRGGGARDEGGARLDPDKHFVVPDEVCEHMDARPARDRGGAGVAGALRALGRGVPGAAARTGTPTAPASRAPGWSRRCPTFPAGEDMATRDAGKKVMQAFKPFTPTMVGGAADLVESTKTEFEGGGLFAATHAGRNIAFGIREHAMGSIVNGIALTRRDAEAVRLDVPDLLRLHAPGRPALGARALPSSGSGRTTRSALGEDGPTHQPVEHHMALRAIPNLWYVRPGDANETAMAWRIALEREGGPVALALTRQKLPTLDRAEVAAAEGALRGAYMLWQRATASPT